MPDLTPMEAARAVFALSPLHVKLAEIRGEFGRVEKTGTNTGVGGGYSFVEATAIAARFVELATARIVTMLPVGGRVIDRYLSISGKQHVIDLETTWRITDAETGDFIDVVSYGQGADNSDKALPKAQTNSMKYAILLVLQKAGDDPEKDSSSNDTGETAVRQTRSIRRRSAAAPATAEVSDAVAEASQEDSSTAPGAGPETADAPEATEQPAARGPRAQAMASDDLKIAIRVKAREKGLGDDQLKALAFAQTGKESSKDWTKRDAEKVSARLDQDAVIEQYKAQA